MEYTFKPTPTMDGEPCDTIMVAPGPLAWALTGASITRDTDELRVNLFNGTELVRSTPETLEQAITILFHHIGDGPYDLAIKAGPLGKLGWVHAYKATRSETEQVIRTLLG